MKIIQMYRHQESVKNADGEKVPSPEGIQKSYESGQDLSQKLEGAEVRGGYSNAIRTELALDHYLEGYGSGTKQHMACLDEAKTPKIAKSWRKELGDDRSMQKRLDEYDKGEADLEEVVNYYDDLRARSKAIVAMIKKEIIDAIKNPDKNEAVVCYTHEPVLALSIIELAKEYLGYDGKSNAEFFKELTGTGQHYFTEGEGYAIEIREEDGQMKAYLITDSGEFELDVEESESEEKSEESGESAESEDSGEEGSESAEE